MKRIIISGMILLLGILNGSKVLAVGKGGVYLSPASVEVNVGVSKPEDSFYLSVGNNNLVGEVMDLSVVDFGSLDESGGVAFLTTSSDKSERKYSLASWVSLEKDMVAVGVGKTELVKVTVINKDSLAPGGHYGAVLATVRSDEKVNQPMVGVNQSLATLIYVLKNGGEKADLEFKSLEYNKNVFYFPKMVNLRFGNNGNVHVVPRGKMEITNSKGEIIAKGIVNADSGKILPESFRVLQTSIKRIKVWNWPGVYNLKLDYRYDGVDNFSEVKTKLVYVGFEGAIIVVGLAGITALVTVLILRRKRR